MIDYRVLHGGNNNDGLVRVIAALYTPHFRGMPPVQTADSFQGREGSISVVITGTRSGIIPGFVADENRLNVILTGQKSGLLIIGDKDVTAVIEGKPKEVQKVEKASKVGKVFYDTNGEKNHSKLKPLRDVIVWIHKKGRILEIKGEKGKNTSKEDNKKLTNKETKLRYDELDWGICMILTIMSIKGVQGILG
ncbi:hypothetical protein QR685DRAFT_585174 [Neurospora intermedia]|uniref:DNA2/NAM7 helicase-like C-terminal domain-containing protein n=1 Tax=Neurospora intermedia TaxID=5142 RepID=A0ABR3DFU3_NEUIN